MPQHIQHSLTHVLLLWTTVLSIVQVAFIIFFFTAGHHSPCQNCTAGEAKYSAMQYQVNNATSFTSKPNRPFGKMLTYEITLENGMGIWRTKDPDTDLISERGEVLSIHKDGYYLVNLQVTVLSPCRDNEKVWLERNKGVLLQGWINNKTCSTGLFSKAEMLSAGDKLEVHPKTLQINGTEYLTYMDIIFMSKP